jgi:hypothetical protein
MRRAILAATLCLLAVAWGALVLNGARAAEEQDKPKYTIKQVMEKAHKNKLLDKIASGQGTKEEAEELLALYKALGANKPPKGELEGWEKKTVAIIEAAQAVVDGKEGAGARLKAAANCAQCHREHRPPA